MLHLLRRVPAPMRRSSSCAARPASVDRTDRVRLMAGLRRSRRRIALLVALADLLGDWPLERVCSGPDPFRRPRRGRLPRPSAAGSRASATSSSSPDPARPSRRQRRRRAGHGQVRRRRAQLLERHRPDPPVRRRGDPLHRRRGADGGDGAPGPLAQLPARAQDQGWLRLPHRSAAAPASAGPSARDLDRRRRALLRAARAELGARELHQGASGRRGSRGRRARSSDACSRTSGASISTTPPFATSTRSSGRSTPIAASAR